VEEIGQRRSARGACQAEWVRAGRVVLLGGCCYSRRKKRKKSCRKVDEDCSLSYSQCTNRGWKQCLRRHRRQLRRRTVNKEGENKPSSSSSSSFSLSPSSSSSSRSVSTALLAIELRKSLGLKKIGIDCPDKLLVKPTSPDELERRGLDGIDERLGGTSIDQAEKRVTLVVIWAAASVAVRVLEVGRSGTR
jgi:hypothetical protein